eukprot:tig00000889_g5314.t1
MKAPQPPEEAHTPGSGRPPRSRSIEPKGHAISDWKKLPHVRRDRELLASLPPQAPQVQAGLPASPLRPRPPREAAAAEEPAPPPEAPPPPALPHPPPEADDAARYEPFPLRAKSRRQRKKEEPEAAEAAVLAWGYNGFGQAGAEPPESVATPRAFHSALLAEDGAVWTWGRGSAGQLGHGPYPGDLPAPRRVALPAPHAGARVRQVACGAFHTVALLPRALLAWGSSSHGQLGLGSSDTEWAPRPVPALSSGLLLKGAACGFRHTLVLAAAGDSSRVFAFGDGSGGQLGLGSAPERVLEPAAVASLAAHRVVALAAGDRHSVAVTEAGLVLTCGDGTYGRLGLGPGAPRQQNTFRLVEALERASPAGGAVLVAQAAAGGATTALLSREGRLYCFGSGTHGQVGDGAGADRPEPVPVATPPDAGRVARVAVGEDHALALTESGRLLVWGRGANGRLGLRPEGPASCPRPAPVPDLVGARLADVAAGGGHSLALALAPGGGAERGARGGGAEAGAGAAFEGPGLSRAACGAEASFLVRPASERARRALAAGSLRFALEPPPPPPPEPGAPRAPALAAAGGAAGGAARRDAAGLVRRPAPGGARPAPAGPEGSPSPSSSWPPSRAPARPASEASGPGLLAAAPAGRWSHFSLLLRDACGNARPSGRPGERPPALLVTAGERGAEARVAPGAEGRWACSYRCPAPGVYRLALAVGGEAGEAVAGSPFYVTCEQGGVEPLRCTASGPGLARAVAGQEARFSIAAADAAGCPMSALPPSPSSARLRRRRAQGGEVFEVAVEAVEAAPEGSAWEGPAAVPAAVQDRGDGNYAVTFVPRRAARSLRPALALAPLTGGRAGTRCGCGRGAGARSPARPSSARWPRGRSAGRAAGRPAPGSRPASPAGRHPGPRGRLRDRRPGRLRERAGAGGDAFSLRVLLEAAGEPGRPAPAPEPEAAVADAGNGRYRASFRVGRPGVYTVEARPRAPASPPAPPLRRAARAGRGDPVGRGGGGGPFRVPAALAAARRWHDCGELGFDEELPDGFAEVPPGAPFRLWGGGSAPGFEALRAAELGPAARPRPSSSASRRRATGPSRRPSPAPRRCCPPSPAPRPAPPSSPSSSPPGPADAPPPPRPPGPRPVPAPPAPPRALSRSRSPSPPTAPVPPLPLALDGLAAPPRPPSGRLALGAPDEGGPALAPSSSTAALLGLGLSPAPSAPDSAASASPPAPPPLRPRGPPLHGAWALGAAAAEDRPELRPRLRALLFKFLADRCGLACRLSRPAGPGPGPPCVAVQAPGGPILLVDLASAPGSLLPLPSAAADAALAAARTFSSPEHA